MRASKILIFLACAAAMATVAHAGNLGPDDQQVSLTGPPGTVLTDAFSPAVAYESSSQRYLAVWSADETDGVFRIWGRLLTGAGGTPLGPPFAIGPAAPDTCDQRQPAVAVDPVRNRFLVVWSGDGLDAGAYEIRGQFVGTDGALDGPVRRYSDMGTNDADTPFDAVTPDLAYHPDLDAFVVVWAGDDDTGGLGDGRFELYGQLVAGADGSETGANDFRISFAGPDGQSNDAIEPAVAVRPGTDRWFVAFEGDITDDGIHSPEVLIYGGTADVPDGGAFLVSMMGTNFNDGLDANNPDLVWVPSSGELMCVWDGLDTTGGPRAIYGQRCNPDGTLVGGVLNLSGSVAGGSGPLREAIHPVIAVDPLTDEWFVAWQGDLDDSLIPFDHEIWAARFNDNGLPVVPQAFPLSAMDPWLVPVSGAGPPALAINTDFGSKLLAWSGDLATVAGDQHEIFSQAWTDDAVSGVDDELPRTFALHGAAPNPFNPTTTIAFDLPRPAPVGLRIYDTAGRLVRTLHADRELPAGRNRATWDGRDDAGRRLASGVYLYRVATPDDEASGRMVLIK